MIRLLGIVILVWLATGCQRNSTESVGGASGVLQMGDVPLADFQVKVFRGGDGTLSEYLCVIESFGTEAPKLSPSYGDKTKSPLKIKQTDPTQQIELRIPTK